MAYAVMSKEGYPIAIFLLRIDAEKLCEYWSYCEYRIVKLDSFQWPIVES